MQIVEPRASYERRFTAFASNKRLGMRIQKTALPKTPTECPKKYCVYNNGGICDEPRINKGNGDSDCHLMSNKDLLRMLTPNKV